MKVHVDRLDIHGVLLLSYPIFKDKRGSFSEIFSAKDFLNVGIDCSFVQDNISSTTSAGTIRGLHFQSAPYAQDKLIRVHRGSIRDVIVDLRPQSPSFGRHLSLTLCSTEPKLLFIPKGFAHGFLSLEDQTEVFYKVSAPYSSQHDCGILWNDPALRIDWGVDDSHVLLSDKDSNLPLFSSYQRESFNFDTIS